MALVKSKSPHIEDLTGGSTIAPDEERNIDVSGQREIDLLERAILLLLDPDETPPAPESKLATLRARVDFDDPPSTELDFTGDGQSFLANDGVFHVVATDGVNSDDVNEMVTLSQAEYDALDAPDGETLYLVPGVSGDVFTDADEATVLATDFPAGTLIYRVADLEADPRVVLAVYQVPE